MKIFHALFSDERGGLEQAYLDYAEALVSQGHTLCLAVHEQTPYRAELGGLKQNVAYFSPKGFYDFVTIWKLRRAIISSKAELVLAHNSRAMSLLWRAMFGLRVPLVGVSHGYKTRRMKRADALIVLTEDMRRHFLADGYDEKRCFVVGNSIAQVAAEYRPMPPVPVIGAIGRLVYEKGFHLLVQALAELSRRGVLCRAVIAGDGVERESLQRFAAEIGAADLISWAGWVKDKSHFYDVVDIIVFPSLNESFGLVVLEAMNYAKPVIASNTVGPSAIIHHGENGLLFPIGDVLALVEALESVIGSPELHARLAAGGKQRSLDFSPERFAQRLDAVIKEVAAAQA